MKIASNAQRSGRQPSRGEQIVLFSIAGETFAISANAVQEIRTTESIAAGASEFRLPGIPKVHHSLRREADSVYIVSGYAHFGLNASRPSQVILLRKHRVAILVDSIERMETMNVLMHLPPGFCGPERLWYRGITLVLNNVVPVLNPSGILTTAEIAQLDVEAELRHGSGHESLVGSPSEQWDGRR